MNIVEQRFINKSINRGGITLYTKEVALEFVLSCKKEGVCLLGIDGFFLTSMTTQPSQENSIDFSSSTFFGDRHEKAISFLQKAHDDLFFEIICE